MHVSIQVSREQTLGDTIKILAMIQLEPHFTITLYQEKTF